MCNCVKPSKAAVYQATTFTVTNKKCYVPVVTLSDLLQELKSDA